MKSDPLKKRIRVSHFGNMNYLGNTYRRHSELMAKILSQACHVVATVEIMHLQKAF